MESFEPIFKSSSDILLESWNFNLLKEYSQMIKSANFSLDNLIFEVATGTGRAVSLLSRFGFQVLTADYVLEKKAEAENRISEKYLHQVNFLQLNLERIPFANHTIKNIVCLNTMHELENPIACLKELTRILSPKGKLLLADFNSLGFDTMDKLHNLRYGNAHTRGKISLQTIKNILESSFSVVEEINTELNTAYLASELIISR